ncbi:MAG TPA: amidohydrolase family protein [Desulfobacteraceae bacterium]|nr:amidohydrolase family protein [Desulfobacteraceae bacterium]HPJ68013.1 amidohydrolase family protein [Desulfobacteraceae bacterium]
MSRVILKNIGTIVSGDITKPLLEGNAISIEDGKIGRIGRFENMEPKKGDTVIDCAGTTVTPGLIDSHCHVILGDFTSRQNQLGFIESELHGGVTTVISAGEVHLKGRPKDPAGTKALAILAAKAWANFRPGGAKVLGGALILEKGLTKKDFEEMAREGVRHVGEIGLGSVKQPEDAAPMVEWAREFGMTVMMHTGGTSIPGSSTVTAEQVIKTNPHIASHVNGGPTAVAIDEVKNLVENTQIAVEIVHCGNPKVAVDAANLCVEAKALDRMIIGNDAPSGTGVIPLGILRVINHLASLTPIRAEEAICMATGNTAKIYKLNRGIICEGKEADLVVMDTPMGSVGEDALAAIEAGDIPGVAMVLVDGEIVATTSRNTPPPKRKPTVTRNFGGGMIEE